MPRQTATTAGPLSLPKAKAALSRLVSEGKVRPAGAKLIDIRELTPRERKYAETLGRARARARQSKVA
jgi:hypothetical protein